MFDDLQAAFYAEIPSPLKPGISRIWDSLATQPELLTYLREANLLSSCGKVCAQSNYFSHQLLSHPQMATALISSGDLLKKFSSADYLLIISKLVEGCVDEESLMTTVRQIRHREMMRIAWRDLSGLSDLSQTMANMSSLAKHLVSFTLNKLFEWQCPQLGTPVNKQGKAQQLLTIAMGKLGGQELNFSSDIDLIFAYPENGDTVGGAQALSNEEFFLKLAQRLIKTLNSVTADGFVFRVDMRLRPFGDSGPLVMSFSAMNTYYQQQGRDWERYALLKARVITGEKSDRLRLMNLLKPFIYRRYVDFGSIESLRNMKQLIAREVQNKNLFDDVKRGPGGIREIEFIGQTFQLIRGGQERRLQQRKILSVLKFLEKTQTLPQSTGSELRHAYQFLRNVEHRLQMLNDRQTHTLPSDDTEKFRLAFSMKFSDWDSFYLDLNRHRDIVENHFQQMLNQPKHEEFHYGQYCLIDLHDLWLEKISSERSNDILHTLGFNDVQSTQNLLKEFRDNYRIRKLNDAGRHHLTNLMPILLQLIGKTENPSLTLNRICQLLEATVRRPAYLALLWENPRALQRLVHLFCASTWISEIVTLYPLLLDEFLIEHTMTVARDEHTLEDELRQYLLSIPEFDLEEQMEALRRFKLRQVLQTSMADIAQTLPLMKVSDHLTFTATTILRQVQEIALKDLLVKNTYPEHENDSDKIDFGIIAYGKLGGIELSYSSDLDLVFLHNNSYNTEELTTRLAQRIIHMINTRTTTGTLYQVDTRLRPSGSSGLLVTSLDAFADYQKNRAWTWEHQALVRARMISGSEAMRERMSAIRLEVLSQPRDQNELREQVTTMRKRMQEANEQKQTGLFDLKQGTGGITDIEFIVQFGVLAWAHEHPEVCRWTDNIRILESFAQEKLMSAEEVSSLIDTYRHYRAIAHRFMLQNQEALVEQSELITSRDYVGNIWRKYLGQH